MKKIIYVSLLILASCSKTQVKEQKSRCENIEDLRLQAITTGDDLAKVFGISNIHFELDKSNINPIAEHDLAKIIAVMNEYPMMKVDIRSHTDSRASIAYNQKLSEKRAQATMKYMIKNGIDKSRLTAKGYGESVQIIKCIPEESCTEEEHELNRRSEFVIKSL